MVLLFYKIPQFIVSYKYQIRLVYVYKFSMSTYIARYRKESAAEDTRLFLSSLRSYYWKENYQVEERL